MSGKSTESFLQSRGAKTLVFDDKFGQDIAKLDPKDFDFAVLSPGISINHELAKKFKEILVSELSLGFSGKHKRIIAVTGTNGKTTVVNLINQALGNKKSVLCGNCGPAVTSVTKVIRKKLPITEVSSFMLELPAPRVSIAVILNITQDHLDRHGTVENYIRHKESLASSQKRSDRLILNYDCPVTKELSAKKRQRVLWFSTKTRVKGIYTEDSTVWLNIRRKRRALFSLNELGLYREHDIQNFLAVALVCKLLGVKDKDLKDLNNVQKHRIEFVKAINNISFYNDSKATNIAATRAAVNSLGLPVHLIMGGQRKGQDFSAFFENLPAHIKHIYVFGQDRGHILGRAARFGFSEITSCKNMEEAVVLANKSATGPQIILLSPACASMDEFRDYQDRGDSFKMTIDKITAL